MELASRLGKRFERTLFFGIFVALASLALMVVSLGLGAGNERQLARAYLLFAGKIDADHDALQKGWEKARNDSAAIKFDGPWVIYDLSYQELAIKYYLTSEHLVDFSSELTDFNNSIGQMEPAAVSRRLRKMAQDIINKPASAYGITIPHELSVQFGGTQVSSSLESITLIVRLMLSPIIILWLGNYLGTRYRELLVIEKTQSIMEIHPHLLNCFAVTYDRPRKKSERISRVNLLLFAAVTRAFIVLILVYPAVVAYVVAVFSFGGDEGYFLFPIGIIGIQALLVVLVEVLPPAWGKLYFRRVFGES